MKKNKVIFIALVCAGLSSACVEWWDRDSSKCKVSTQVSRRYLTFPNTGGEELVDVNPNPYYGDTALKFEVVVKGGDCSEIIYCTIKP